MTVRRTPAGARLEVTRTARWVTIAIDRWPITDATAEQQARVIELAEAQAQRCFAAGRRKAICYGGGPTFWHLTAPREDEEAALAALFAIEGHEQAAS